MRTTTATTVILFISSSVWAAPLYRIQSQIFMNGKLLSVPSIITQTGETAEISQSIDQEPPEEMRLSVRPSEVSNEKMKDGVLMQFQIDITSGGQTFHAAPQITAKPGSEAVVTIGKNKENDEFTLKVLATRE
jgi:hypothetical protein